jgi:seryl-tRNA synthetase
MHDIRAIRANASAFDAALARRGMPSASEEILARDAERRAAQTALQEKQARRNTLSREIGQGKRTGADTATREAEATALRVEMDALEKQAAAADEVIPRLLEVLPNVLDWIPTCRTDWKKAIMSWSRNTASHATSVFSQSRTGYWARHWG